MMLWQSLVEDDLQNLRIENDVDSIIVVANSLEAFKTQGLFKIFSNPSSWKLCMNHKMIRQLKQQVVCYSGESCEFYDIFLGNNGRMNVYCLIGVTKIINNHGRCWRKDENHADALIQGKERFLFLKRTIQPAINRLANGSRSQKFRNQTPLGTNSSRQALIVHENDWPEFSRNVNSFRNNFISAIQEGSSRLVISWNFYMQMHGQQLTEESADNIFKSVLTEKPSNATENYQILCQIHKSTTIYPGVGKACFLSFDDSETENGCRNKKNYQPYGLYNAGHTTIKGSLPFHEDHFHDDEAMVSLLLPITNSMPREGRDECLECYIKDFIAYFQAYDPNIHIMKANHHEENLYACNDLVFTPYFIFGGYRFCKDFQQTREKVVTHLCRWRQFLKAVNYEVPLRMEVVYNLPDTYHPIIERVILHNKRGRQSVRTINVCDPIMTIIIKKLMSKRQLISCTEGWSRYVELAGMDILAHIDEELNTIPPYGDRGNFVAVKPHLARSRKCTQKVYDSENILIKWTIGAQNSDVYDYIDYERLNTIAKSNLLVEKFPIINSITRQIQERNNIDDGPLGLTTVRRHHHNVSNHLLLNNDESERAKKVITLSYYIYDSSKVIPMTQDEITQVECIRVRNEAIKQFALQLWKSQSDRCEDPYEMTSHDHNDECERRLIAQDIERLILNYAIRYSALNNLRVPRSAMSALKKNRLQHQPLASEYGAKKSTLIGTLTIHQVMEDLLCKKNNQSHGRKGVGGKNEDGHLMSELLLSACVEKPDDPYFQKQLLSFIERNVEIYCLPEDDPGKYRKWRLVENEAQSVEKAWGSAFRDVVERFKLTKRLLMAHGLKDEPTQEWQKELAFRLKDNKRKVPIMAITMLYTVLNRTEYSNNHESIRNFDPHSFFSYCSENDTYLKHLEKLDILQGDAFNGDGSAAATFNSYKITSTLYEKLTESYERRQEANHLRLRQMIGDVDDNEVDHSTWNDEENINRRTVTIQEGNETVETTAEAAEEEANRRVVTVVGGGVVQSRPSSSTVSAPSSSSKAYVLRNTKGVDQGSRQFLSKNLQCERRNFAENKVDAAGSKGRIVLLSSVRIREGCDGATDTNADSVRDVGGDVRRRQNETLSASEAAGHHDDPHSDHGGQEDVRDGDSSDEWTFDD